MKDVVIIDGARTPFGTFGGGLRDVSATDLGVIASKAALERSKVDPKQIDGAADRQLTFPLGPTNKGHMKGDDYLNHFVLPNVYFHLTAAYAILRHCGVEIGKQDFLGAIPMKMT